MTVYRCREAKFAIINGHAASSLPAGQPFVETPGGETVCLIAKEGNEISLGPLPGSNSLPSTFCHQYLSFWFLFILGVFLSTFLPIC